jgi:phosphoserine phosphatase
MNMVLTLVVKANNPDLLNKCLEASRSALRGQSGIYALDISELASDQAIDLIFESAETLENLKAVAAKALAGLSVDWALQRNSNRRKKLLLADMDSTMITVECIDELADFAGLKGKVSAITEAAMRGELDFESALKERVALLKGMNIDTLDQCFSERIKLSDGAKNLLVTMSAHNAYSALVSGGFTFFTEKVAAILGFSMNKANILGIEGNQLTGEVILPICDANTKEETLQSLKVEHNLTTDDIIAVGDGANDIPMLKAAGLGVAYRAKPIAQQAADASINYTDLTSLLFFQGFKSNEFM